MQQRNDDQEQRRQQDHNQGMQHQDHQAMMQRGIAHPHGTMAEMHGGHEQMTTEQRHMMQRRHHRQTLWVYLLLVLLGAWLISSPFTFAYTEPGSAPQRVREITSIRGLAPIADRARAMLWSDVISGVLLVGLGLLSLNPRRVWAPWAACIVGIWILFAPLLLWSPSAAAYAIGTFVGALVIALTILIPDMPGMALIMEPGPEVPPGWSYNPSSWLQRAPIIALGWFGFFLSRYLAAYQLGYIDRAWDPFFGTSTMRILDSDVSRAWPISDAGLGAFSYAFEALMGYMGDTRRWRTMPWMVTFFGILVIPLGTVSIVLVILQPIAVGTWCTLCLATAVAMLIMIPLTIDEVVAMLQFLVRSRRDGKSLWRTFFLGGTIEGGAEDQRSPRFNAPLGETAPAMLWGISIPWSLLLSAAIGIWLMAAPNIFGTQGAAADSDHLIGALVVTVALIAMAEVARPLRLLNLLFGIWFIAAPWLLSGATTGATWNNIIAGIILLLLSIPRGPVREHYGSWTGYIR